MSELSLLAVNSTTIEEGPIPFNLYARDKKGRMVLFCKKGFPITSRHREYLTKRSRIFFVSADQLNDYHDYHFERIDRIISNEDVSNREKAEVVRGVGKRIVDKLLDDPRSGKAVTHSGKFVNTCVDLIFHYPHVTEKLLALGSSDSYILSHSINVCTFSLLIGKKLMGGNNKELWRLGMSGLLQDVGMSKIPRIIIDKPGKLTKDEMEKVKHHTEYSVEMISEHNLADSVVNAVGCHHERSDGSGYPKGLKGEEIQPFARILAVADVYDALTSDRPYRKAMSHLEAITEMAKEADRYDCQVFKALMEIVLGNVKLVEGFVRKYDIETESTSEA